MPSVTLLPPPPPCDTIRHTYPSPSPARCMIVIIKWPEIKRMIGASIEQWCLAALLLLRGPIRCRLWSQRLLWTRVTTLVRLWVLSPIIAGDNVIMLYTCGRLALLASTRLRVYSVCNKTDFYVLLFSTSIYASLLCSINFRVHTANRIFFLVMTWGGQLSGTWPLSLLQPFTTLPGVCWNTVLQQRWRHPRLWYRYRVFRSL